MLADNRRSIIGISLTLGHQFISAVSHTMTSNKKEMVHMFSKCVYYRSVGYILSSLVFYIRHSEVRAS